MLCPIKKNQDLRIAFMGPIGLFDWAPLPGMTPFESNLWQQPTRFGAEFSGKITNFWENFYTL